MRQSWRLPSKCEDHFFKSNNIKLTKAKIVTNDFFLSPIVQVSFKKKLFFELLVEGGPLNEYTKAISLFVEFSLFIYKI